MGQIHRFTRREHYLRAALKWRPGNPAPPNAGIVWTHHLLQAGAVVSDGVEFQSTVFTLGERNVSGVGASKQGDL